MQSIEPGGRPLRILILEDVPADAELMEKKLREGGVIFTSLRVDTERAYRDALEEYRPDIVLADYSLPSFDGISALRMLTAKCPEVPLLFVFGTVGEELASEAVREGASDYIHKDRLTRIGPALRRALRDVEERALRRQAEEKLRSSDERYRSLFENMVEGYACCRMIYDGARPVDFVYLEVNEAFTKLTGLSDIIGKKFSEVLPGIREADPELFDTFGRVALTGKPERFESYVEALGNWFSVSAYPSKKEHFVAVFDVITERKRAEETTSRFSMRKRAEEDIKGLAKFPSETPDPVMRISTGGTVLYINGAGSEKLSEWNLQVGNIAPPILRDAVSQAMDEGSRIIFDLEYGESTYSFSVSPSRDGGYANLYGRNITERKQMENALKESERKYRMLVANAGEAIFIAQNETIKFPNPKALEITGYSAEELAGISIMKLTHPEDRGMVVERYISRLRGGLPPHPPVPFRILKKTGDVAWVRGTAGLVEWEGKPGLLCIVSDITTEKNLEAQVAQSQKLEAVGRLAGGIAHDFNNLLTVSIGYCDLALTRIADAHPLRHDLEEIRKSSERCATLTRQLLAFSRKQILEPKVINLGDVVADMDKMLQRLISEDIELVSVREKDLWNVKADPGQIEQVLVNLVVNARDAMPGGGKLSIETANVVLDELYSNEHKFVPPGSYVRLAVSDTGEGMDEGTLARIFEPFFTTKEKGKGTGLGLSTVYGIVKQSDGHVNVYSGPGIGTTFKIYFPRVEETVTVTSGAGVPRPEELRGSETILMVEDEELVGKMVREVLVHLGYSVVEARSGSEAIDLCARHRGTIQLMLSDVVMPGMSGVELSKRLAPFHPDMKVLFMSGYTANAIVHQGILDPGIAILHKPFTMYSLAYKVRTLLDSGIKLN